MSPSAAGQQVDDDVLDVFADVAGLGERRRVGDGEGHLEDARERLRQQRLARARRADEQDVALLELDVVGVGGGVDALVVVVDGDAEDLLRALLADDVLVEDGLDLRGLEDHGGTSPGASASASTSSAMMSLQRPMHSSQM
jgi:hypothetical protein